MANKVNPFEHVVDSDHIPILETGGLEIHGLGINIGTVHIPLKFILLMTASAALVAWGMIWLGKKMASGEPPTGKMWNLLESLLFFVRDKIVVPGVGEKDANRYLPYMTTLFLFIFVMNLMGLIPFLGSPTASIMVTGALAVISFVVIHAAGLEGNHGVAGYLKTFIPHIHIEGGRVMKGLGLAITIGMALLEYLTAFIRATVLAVRLFANMLAGHTVLFMLLFFIALVANPEYQIEVAKGKDWLFWGVMPFSVVMVTLLTLLELFIAGLQAFIFTFLTAVYIGLAKHPPH